MTFVIWCYIFAWLEKQMKIFYAFEMENIRPNMFGLINILKPWKNSHFIAIYYLKQSTIMYTGDKSS